MGRVMAVYDVDPFYADRFADTVNQREKLPFTVMAFTTLERLKTYAKEHAVDLLLISSAVPKEEVEAIGAARVVTLADGDTVPAEWEYPSIYKYQSSSDIVREVMACYCKDEAEPAVAVLGRAATVIGVYSPVGRCSKTSFALVLGQLMAADSRVLYVNLEEYSGFSALIKEPVKGDLSDVMYFTGREIAAACGSVRWYMPSEIWTTYRRCAARRIWERRTVMRWRGFCGPSPVRGSTISSSWTWDISEKI